MKFKYFSIENQIKNGFKSSRQDSMTKQDKFNEDFKQTLFIFFFDFEDLGHVLEHRYSETLPEVPPPLAERHLMTKQDKFKKDFKQTFFHFFLALKIRWEASSKTKKSMSLHSV